LKCGLHAAFAFPILTGGRVSAVLSFFSRSIRQPEADLLKMTADLGVLIGQLIARKRVEEQLFHSQKVEAIGRLAGGVAHDFNNLLTVITGYSELALAEIPENDRMHPNLEEIRKAAQRAAALTRQLLAFSRQQPVEPKLVDLNGIIKDMERMLVRLIGEDVELSTSLAPHLGRVNADPGQLEQVIVNLAVNARDAMPHGGKLVLETTNIDLDDTYCQSHPEARPVPHVQLSVTDTGTGMDAETQARIFEPFFTTKESGKGTGLGLSTVHGIVKQNGGHLEVYSELGRGTTFKVYLPRSQKSGQTSKIIRPQSKPARGSETILVAEDSESVRKLMKEILRSCGYQVLEADEGSRALDVCDRHEGPIHLLVTDTVMPGMSGPELAQHVRRKKPGIRILLTSGYTERGMSNHGLPEQGHPFLEKPFTVESLTHKVREVLDTPLGP
jgi:signal transduction histidine kinase